MLAFRRLPYTIALLSALALAACDEQQAEAPEPVIRPVLSMVIGDVESFRTDSYTGRARAVREVNIGFEVSGKLITRPVDVGSVVAAGDQLATLEPDPYMARIRTLEGERAALDAALSNATTELNRRQTLLEKDFVSQANVDDQMMLVQAAEAKIEAVDGLLDAARLNLGYTSLTAPFAGTISEVFVENFQNVVAKQPVMRLLDTSRIEMEISVPEGLIGLAPFVRSITVTFNSFPDVVIPAAISNISNEASLTTRTYPVTIVMDQPAEGVIQPGMAGRVTGVAELPPDWTNKGVEVPAGAVFSPNSTSTEDKFVWVIDPATMTVSSKPVTLVGLADRGLRLQGLAAGDRIVVAGANFLTEGQKVRLAAE